MTQQEKDEERAIHKAQLDSIRVDINEMKIEGRWISAIQIGALVLAFFWGVTSVQQLKKKI